jgi:GTP-binding protein Era
MGRPEGITVRSGFCSLVGRPNVGKSTLLNALVGEKIAITTPVPQTTRHVLRGVLNRDGVQVVFTDTPGVHKPRTLLGSRLNDLARSTLSSVDCIVFLVDGSQQIGRGDEFLAGLLADVGTPVIAALNKVDAFARKRQLPQLARLAELGDWAEVVPLSAATGDNVDVLADLIAARMPEGPAYFPLGQVTDQPLEQRIAEIIREKAITALREEVPHSVAVAVEEVTPGQSQGVTVVSANLYVERDSQKGIVIGKGGGLLRDIGAQARQELEPLLGTAVYLDLRVKLMKEWQRDPRKLERLGY